MSFRLGRILDPQVLRNVAAIPMSGSKGAGQSYEFSGRITTDDPIVAQRTADQLLGYDSNEDEPAVGITYDEHPAVNAFWNISNVQVQIDAGGLELGYWPWSFTATKAVEPAGYPVTESSIFSVLRSNGLTIAAAATTPWHAVPNAAQGYDFDGRVDLYDTRVGPGGTVRFYGPASQAYAPAAFPVYGLSPLTYTDQRCYLKVNGVEFVGKQNPNSPNVPDLAQPNTNNPLFSWELGNNQLKLVAAPVGSTHLFDLYLPVSATPTTWGTAQPIAVGDFIGGAFNMIGSAAVDAPMLWEILRNSMEEIGIRILLPRHGGASNAASYIAVEIWIRRGSRFVTVSMASPWSFRPAIGFNTTTACATVDTAVQRQSVAVNGNRVVFACTLANTKDNVEGFFYATNTTNQCSFMVAGEIGGSGSASPDRTVDLKAQWFSAQTEIARILSPRAV